MNNAIKCVREYKNADFSKRLNMYMQYPKLRQIFMHIDNDQPITLKNYTSEKKQFRFKIIIANSLYDVTVSIFKSIISWFRPQHK
jgi:hypothetical protein